MEKWFVAMKKADFQGISEKYHISPITARLIRNRDIIGDEAINLYLNGMLTDLYDGMLMKDMDRAVNILMEKIYNQVPIRVIGDYDIDGVNATYILQEGLSRLGAEIDTDIPDRMKDGFGLNKNLIDRALKDGIDTIITCDNGIAAKEEIAYGKANGLTIIVTDHHEVPYVELDGKREYLIPEADAVVDPHRKDCPYPFKGLCGAGVAYKVVEALYEVMQRDVEDIDYLMENVAIATVGDVMDLQGENRIFVKQGLEMLKCTHNQGLKALMDCTKVPVDTLNAYHIGFVIGPCINAGGRLDTAKRALALLNAKSRREAVTLAQDLKSLNDSRKEMTERGVQQAIQMIETTDLKKDKVLVIYLPDCHESIAGIIAGRIRERYYRPVFILTSAEEGAKGSGRSIESYHMFEEMCKCSFLFTKFGGHKLAAGLSLKTENIDRFRKTINELSNLTEEDLLEKVSIDMQLPIPYISENLISELELLEPFGKGNTKPLFAEKNLKVIQPRIIGKNHNVLKFQVEDQKGNRMDAIYFGDVKKCLETMQRQNLMAFTYYPTVNEYMGNKTLQMVVVNYK
ncbi:MAG: single-stranded-DNA-specific exonuclease RecJ [Ruminococcus sp.]|nr:single-stranded-DNA-specific exonuclease RecJ [Ruminococcus sp.]